MLVSSAFNMPSISEMMMTDANQSEETSQSLVVSASSPEQPVPQRALQVIKTNTKGSSSRSSSSSSRPPTGRSSHRGPGSLHLYDQRSMTEHHSETSSVHLQDQRSITQNFDQRSVQLLSVGVDPGQVVVREAEILQQAHAAVSEARGQTQRVMSQAESEVRALQSHVQTVQGEAQSSIHEARTQVTEAQAKVQSIESRASVLMAEMQANHRKEIVELQDVAQRAYSDSQQQLRVAEERNRELLEMIDSQNRALVSQRKEQKGLSAQLAALQNEVTMLRHSACTPSQVQDQNGAVNQTELLSVIESLRQEIRQSRAPAVPIDMPVPGACSSGGFCAKGAILNPSLVTSIATPPEEVTSACAGYPHQQPVSPIKVSGSGSRRSKISTIASMNITPSTPPGQPPSDSSSSSDHGPGGVPGPWGLPPGPPDDSHHGSQGSGSRHPHNMSVGVGSAVVLTENDVYRYKSLTAVKIESLPQDAAAYRGWKNGLVTRLCSIDVTGKDIILEWILEALDATADLTETKCMALPRLDAFIAATLAEPKHLKGDLGVQFQAYVEQCQMHRVSPKGRFMLQLVAKRFQLDLNRGSNLTQQSLLELTLESYSHEALSKFIERIELVMNSIPPSHQPSEMTKFTWLFSRLKPCRHMQRFIERIKDAREGSHVRSWDWLYGKLKNVVIELQEDANEEAVRRALSPNKPKPKPKGEGKGKATPAKGENLDEEEANRHAMPNPTAKPKAKPKGGPKGAGKGKEEGSQEKPKATPHPKGKPSSPAPHAKAKPKAEPGKPTVKCLFYPNCNRGSSCPFLHEGAPKAKAEAKSQPKAAAKAAVATLLASSVKGAEASGTNMTLMGKTFDMFMYPFKALFASIAAVSSLIAPGSIDKAKPGGCL